MSSTRIYVVRPKKPGDAPRLVSAASQGAALRHVAASTLTVAVAGQNELVQLIGNGVKVEDPSVTPPEGDKDGAQ
jgi:hypothetical protein